MIETIELADSKPFTIGRLTITPFLVQTTFNPSTVFLLQEGEKRVIYAPCDVKPFSDTRKLKNPNLLILGSFHLEGPLREGIVIPEDNPLRKELFSLEELRQLAEELNASKTIVTHMEEEWGKTHDEYR